MHDGKREDNVSHHMACPVNIAACLHYLDCLEGFLLHTIGRHNATCMLWARGPPI